MYVLVIKNGVAMGKILTDNIESIDMTLYDSFEEITENEFSEIQIPAKKEGGVWVKTSDVPFLELEETEPTPSGTSVYDELAEAYRKGVQEA